MKRVALIYTTGCRKYRTIKQALLDIGLPFEEVNQAQLHKGCVCRNFTSPTILVDEDIIIFGGPRKSKLKKESSELAYLKNIPNKKELRALLEMAGIFSTTVQLYKGLFVGLFWRLEKTEGVEKLLTKVKVLSVDVNHYQTLNELKMEKHPDKTFIGRIAKGFDFLGYSFEPKGLSIAPKTLANFFERIAQLYEQGPDVRRI